MQGKRKSWRLLFKEAMDGVSHTGGALKLGISVSRRAPSPPVYPNLQIQCIALTVKGNKFHVLRKISEPPVLDRALTPREKGA